MPMEWMKDYIIDVMNELLDVKITLPIPLIVLHLQHSDISILEQGLLTACTSSMSTVRSYEVRFMDWNTSRSVMLCPLLFVTTSSVWFFSVFLMKRRRCFWFIQDAAWMCVSTCHQRQDNYVCVSLKQLKSDWFFKIPRTFLYVP
jgi:hypothetical protein